MQTPDVVDLISQITGASDAVATLGLAVLGVVFGIASYRWLRGAADDSGDYDPVYGGDSVEPGSDHLSDTESGDGVWAESNCRKCGHPFVDVMRYDVGECPDCGYEGPTS